MTLSPGQWHKKVPRDPVENMKFRLAIYKRANADRSFQRGLVEICRQDILFFINAMVFQTNPNADNEQETVGPFIAWPFQERAILSENPEKPGILWCIDNRRSLVIEKSREMGATWLVLIVKDWKCRFTPYYDSLMMSKSANAVDDNTRQSLYGKLRFIHKHLPDFLHDAENFIDNKNAFIYTGTESTQKGFASTGKAGVSERGRDMLFDEFAHIEEDREVLSRTADTSKCRIFVSTHMGLGTAFYSLTQDPHFKKIVFHWTQHPAKNKGMYRWNRNAYKFEYLSYNESTDSLDIVDSNGYEYQPDFVFDQTGEPVGGPHPGVRSPAYDYAFKEKSRNVAEMAKDWDINPSGSVAQFYDAMVIGELKTLCRPPRAEYEMEHIGGDPVRLTLVDGGRIKLWCPLDSQGMPPRAFYGAGADISEGTGCTPSCLSIFSAKTGEKVLEYENPELDPKDFATLCVALCRMFVDEDGQSAKLNWETAGGPGQVYGNKVKELKYSRLYYNVKSSRMGDVISTTPGSNPGHTGMKLEWHSDYRMALIERRAVNRSKHALDETLNFKHDGKGSVEHTQYKNKDRPEAGRENHGDIVVADVLAWRVIKGYTNAVGGVEVLVAPPGSFQWWTDKEKREKMVTTGLHPEGPSRLHPLGRDRLHQRR